MSDSSNSSVLRFQMAGLKARVDAQRTRWQLARFRWLLFVPFLFFEGLSLWLLGLQVGVLGLPYQLSVLGMHGVACLFLWWAVCVWKPRAGGENAGVLGAMVLGLSISLPVAGPTCVFLMLYLIGERRPAVVKKEVESPFTIGTRVPSASELDFVNGPDASTSMLGVMTGPDVESRRNLILGARNLPANDAVPLLRTGLIDSDEEVKLYSQSRLSAIVEQYEETIASFKQGLDEKPEDTSLLLSLAEQYTELVTLDLVIDPEIQRFYLRQAADLTERACRVAPEETQPWMARAQYALALGDTEVASQAIEHLEQLGAGSEVTEPLAIEVCFLRRDWDQFRESLAEGLRNRFVAPSVQALGEFWLPPMQGSSSLTEEPVEQQFG